MWYNEETCHGSDEGRPLHTQEAKTPAPSLPWTAPPLLEVREYGAQWQMPDLEASLGFAFDLGQLFAKRPEMLVQLTTGPMTLSLQDDFEFWLETALALEDQLIGFAPPALVKAGPGSVAHFDWQAKQIVVAGPEARLVSQAEKIFAEAAAQEPRGFAWIRGAVLEDDDPDHAQLVCVEAAAALLSRYGRLNKHGELTTPALMVVEGRKAELELRPPLDPAHLRKLLLEAWDAANGDIDVLGLFPDAARATFRPSEGDFRLKAPTASSLEARTLVLKPWLPTAQSQEEPAPAAEDGV